MLSGMYGPWADWSLLVEPKVAGKAYFLLLCLSVCLCFIFHFIRVHILLSYYFLYLIMSLFFLLAD